MIDYKKFVNGIPAILEPLMKPFMEQIEEALTPGLTQLSWTSSNIDKCMDLCYFYANRSVIAFADGKTY